MNTSTTFIVVRHEKVDNPESIFYGVSYDLPISQQGIEDAKILGWYLRDIPLSAVVVSTLKRTQMTAEGILEGMGLTCERSTRRDNQEDFSLTIQRDTRLTDVAYPEIEGLYMEERYVTLNSEEVYLNAIEPYAAETLEEVGQRFQLCLQDLAQRYSGGTVLVVSHGEPIATGLARLENPEGEIPSIAQLLTEDLYPDKGGVAIVKVNGDGMLDGEIHRNPQLSDIPQLFTEGRISTGKERG